MQTGIILALISAFFFSFSNIAIKYYPKGINHSFSLFFQYLSLLTIAFIYTFLSGHLFVDLSFQIILILFINGIIGYLGIYFLIKGFDYLGTGIVMILSSFYIVFAYFLNSYAFPDIEKFSLLKMVFAIIFVLLISLFVFEKNEGEKYKINKYIIFPILTALCWGFYDFINNYIIKTGTLTPESHIFYSDLFIFLIAIIAFCSSKSNLQNIKKLKIRQYIPFFLWGVFIFFALLLDFFAYSMIAGNIVNVIWHNLNIGGEIKIG